MNLSVAAPRSLLLLALLAAFLWFANLDYRHLVKTDEGRYAEIAREMMADDDWVTPRLNGYKYFYKPPLQYWATAAAYKAFGINEWTARLWTALTGFVAALFAAFAGARLFGTAVGILSGTVLFGSAYWVSLGHFASLDMSLAAFLSASIFALALAQSDQTPPAGQRAWMILAWACAALALMSKGLIGVVLPAGALGLYVLWHRDWRLLARLQWLPGIAVFAIITVPWFVLVAQRNSEFVEFFFIREHFTRFLTKEHGRYEPWWYFIPVLLVGLLPFTTAVIGAIRAGISHAPSRFQPQRLLLAWIVVVFVFFSASSSKLPSYLLPIVPAMAVLVALHLATMSGRALVMHWIVALALGIGLIAGAFYAQAGARHAEVAALMKHYIPWLVGAGITFTAGAIVAIVLARRTRILASVLAIGVSSLLGMQLIISGHQSLAPVYSSYHIVQKIKPELTPQTRLYFVGMFEHSLPFYLQRTLTIVAFKDELAAAIDWEPQRYVDSFAAFEKRWLDDADAIAVMAPDVHASFQLRALPMRVIARDARRVVVHRSGS